MGRGVKGRESKGVERQTSVCTKSSDGTKEVSPKSVAEVSDEGEKAGESANEIERW